MKLQGERIPDLGDLVIILLAGTLAGVRDRLADDGFESAADVVGDLVELTDDYIRTSRNGMTSRLTFRTTVKAEGSMAGSKVARRVPQGC